MVWARKKNVHMVRQRVHFYRHSLLCGVIHHRCATYMYMWRYFLSNSILSQSFSPVAPLYYCFFTLSFFSSKLQSPTSSFLALNCTSLIPHPPQYATTSLPFSSPPNHSFSYCIILRDLKVDVATHYYLEFHVTTQHCLVIATNTSSNTTESLQVETHPSVC